MKRSLGVTVIGALSTVFGVIAIAGGGIMAFVGVAANTKKNWGFNYLLAIVGVICLAVGFLSAIVGVGLLKLMNWARGVAVGLSIFNLAFFLVFLAGRRMVPFPKRFSSTSGSLLTC